MTIYTVPGGGPLRGSVRVPGDKSISHRALILAALADGTSEVVGLSAGQDVQHTLQAIQSLGAQVDGTTITGGKLREPEAAIEVGNSGTGIRLLAGVCAAQSFLSVLQGDSSIAQRPMDRIALPLRQMGAHIDGREDGKYPPLVIRGGGLSGITYEMPIASAQVKGAILLAGLKAEGETTVVQPDLCRMHTEEMLLQCGVDLTVDGNSVTLRPSAVQSARHEVPADPSQAAFWAVAATIVPGSEVNILGVYHGPGRSDFINVLRRMGADIEVDAVSGDMHVRSASLKGTVVTAEEFAGLQDEIPVLGVAAALAEGSTTFEGAAELRVKESDRVTTTIAALGEFGARAEPTPDGLVVHGGSHLSGGGVVQSHHDHRIAMAGAVAAMAATGETQIQGWDAVATSYPGFATHLEELTR